MCPSTVEITLSVRKKLVIFTVELGMDLAKARLRELSFCLSLSSSSAMVLKKVTFMIGESE